ncbi:MAG: hypothetical protein PHQ36_10465, partial [Anaerolineales bacterium]|nr:hypothetical protein [Anaerolineales bacterium]
MTNLSMTTMPSNTRSRQKGSLLGAALAILPLLISIALLVWGFFFLRDIQQAKDTTVPQGITVLFAIIWGVGGVVLLFTTANFFIEQLPDAWMRRLQPIIFVGPAMIMLIWALVIPTIRTLILSFYDEASVNLVWFENFKYVFTNPNMLTVFRNNLLWMIFGTTFTVSSGLLIAVLADRSRFENFAKALIFMPMAISFVGAGVIWNFV